MTGFVLQGIYDHTVNTCFWFNFKDRAAKELRCIQLTIPCCNRIFSKFRISTILHVVDIRYNTKLETLQSPHLTNILSSVAIISEVRGTEMYILSIYIYIYICSQKYLNSKICNVF